MRRSLLLVASGLVLAACEVPSFGAPDPASRQGSDVLSIWKGFFLAGLGVAALVLGLILYSAVRFRRRNDDIPNQRASNVRMEVLYTVTPIVIVAVLFGVSVAAEQRLTRTSASPPPMVVHVTGFQWGWQFDYPDEHVTVVGTGEQQTPELVLPVDQTVQLVLRTNDVNHAFWVPQFLEKRDLIQGVDNTIDITPDKVGVYDGKCAEYCGLDHWRMSFDVKVVSAADFDQWVAAHR